MVPMALSNEVGACKYKVAKLECLDEFGWVVFCVSDLIVSYLRYFRKLQ